MGGDGGGYSWEDHVEHRRQSDGSERPEAPQKKGEEQHEIKEVRASDLEPYTGLRYLSKLFRFMAVVLVLLRQLTTTIDALDRPNPP